MEGGGKGEMLDVIGLRTDHRNLCLVDKKWCRAAREHLYRDLWVPDNKTAEKRKFSSKQPLSRLRKLLDSLRDTPGLGFLVHRMRITTELAEELNVEANLPWRKGSALDLLAEVVRQCYNLEQLSGFTLPATSSTIPVMEALASRTRLKTHIWDFDSRKALPSLADFVHCHEGWYHLETLVLKADAGVDLGMATVSAILRKLPRLQHLMISGLHRADFHNTTLLTLPTVRSLRLENLGGLTDQGVEQLAFSRLALSLEKLTLVGLELVSLHTVQTLMSHLTRLRKFALVQNTSPEPQTGVKTAKKPMPLSSPSLRYLHWDCLISGSALALLADAIEDGKFPKLKMAKVPCDYDGLIQRLCRPMPLKKLTSSDLDHLAQHTQNRYERNLRTAQIQAQIRVIQSRKQPSINVVVQDESMEVQSLHTIGSYIGSMDSKIEYVLEPEVDGKALAELDSISRLGKSGQGRSERVLDVSVLF